MEKKVFTIEEVTAMLNGNVTEESLSALSAIISDKKAAKAAAEKAAAKVKAEEEAKLAAEKLLREYEATAKEAFKTIRTFIGHAVKNPEYNTFEQFRDVVMNSLNSMPKAPAAKKVAKAGTGTSHARKEGGVIATIEKLITDSGEAGITKEDIHAGLVIAFPERDADSMKVTVNAQVPSKLKERGCIVERTEAGTYHKVN